MRDATKIGSEATNCAIKFPRWLEVRDTKTDKNSRARALGSAGVSRIADFLSCNARA